MAFLIILMTFGLISCAGLPDFELSINSADLEQPEREVAETQNVWQYFTVTNCKIVRFL